MGKNNRKKGKFQGSPKDFQRFAAMLPPFMENTKEKHKYTGAELIEWGFTDEFDGEQKGQPLNPGATYIYNFPVQVLVNHARRVRKAFLRGGYPELNKYLQGLADKVIAQKQLAELSKETL